MTRDLRCDRDGRAGASSLQQIFHTGVKAWVDSYCKKSYVKTVSVNRIE